MSTSYRANGHIEDCVCTVCDDLYYQAIVPTPEEEAEWERIKDSPGTIEALYQAGYLGFLA